MLDERARWLHHFDLELPSTPPGAPPVPLAQTLPFLQSHFESGEAVQLVAGGMAAVRLRDFSYDTSRISMLIQYTDKRATDAAYAHFETGDIRIEPKLEGEGGAVAAHLIVSRDEAAPGVNVYPTLLERVPGLSRSRVSEFLTYLLRMATLKRFSFEDENGKKKNVRPMARLSPYASNTLREGLRNGELHGIEVVRFEVKRGQLDENDVIKERSQVLRILAAPRTKFQEALDLVTKQFEIAQSGNADQFVVRIKQDGRTYPLLVPMDTTDAADTFFSKADYVELDSLIPACSEAPHQELLGRMYRLLERRQKEE